VTFADLGTRIGEDNETLRNLLLDTDRRLTSLDELKVAFRSLVEPIGAALRSLEQEKTDNVTLRNALAELRTSHDTVRKESHTFERQVGELANDNASLRRELALAQQATKDLETERAELASELLAARSEIAKLDSQLAQETANGRALGEANQILADHGSNADRRIVELQGDCSLARENLLLLENDKHSLQSALDQTLAENSRLSRRLTESESALTAARARLEQMEISLAAAEKERACPLRCARRGQRAPSIRMLRAQPAAGGAAFACQYGGEAACGSAAEPGRAHRGDQGVGAQAGGSLDCAQCHRQDD
jgi:crescentin